jgi:hypothetical protein
LWATFEIFSKSAQSNQWAIQWTKIPPIWSPWQSRRWREFGEFFFTQITRVSVHSFGIYSYRHTHNLRWNEENQEVQDFFSSSLPTPWRDSISRHFAPISYLGGRRRRYHYIDQSARAEVQKLTS